jgi:hypothetical protein
VFRHAGRIIDRCPSYTICSAVATAGDFSRRREGMEGCNDGRGETHAPALSASLQLYMTREVVHMASLDLDESHRVVVRRSTNRYQHHHHRQESSNGAGPAINLAATPGTALVHALNMCTSTFRETREFLPSCAEKLPPKHTKQGARNGDGRCINI